MTLIERLNDNLLNFSIVKVLEPVFIWNGTGNLAHGADIHQAVHARGVVLCHAADVILIVPLFRIDHEQGHAVLIPQCAEVYYQTGGCKALRQCDLLER